MSYIYIWISFTKFLVQINIYILICLLWSLKTVAQDPIIDINSAGDVQSFFGPEQLIEDVLINTPCSTVRDFTYQVFGDLADNDTKSYGYFKKAGGTTFPFEEGIVISTGKVFQGGNSIDSETLGGCPGCGLGLSGDSDLDAALNSTEISQDATFIKFTFTPISDSISFRYLMASEEYDEANNYECEYTDGFAFLLREVGTTNYTNLAVLNDGSPVTVTNINNTTGDCNSNPDLFEGYNPPIRDTNYNGRTVVLTAFANVIPNIEYEIKLVVADYGQTNSGSTDNRFDTAIFLEAGSFNIGLNLGEDVTADGGTALCFGETLTLDTLIDTTVGSHTWYQDGAVITGETNATLDVTESGEYTVEVDFSGTCTATDSINIEFTPIPILNPIGDQFICDDDNDGFWSLDLDALASQVLGAQESEDFTVSFHESQTDADTSNNALTTPYTNTQAYTEEEISIRIENNSNNACFNTGSFLFNVFNQPQANAQVVSLCDNDDDGDATNGLIDFDLTALTPLVLGGQDEIQFYVSYHINQSDADTASGELPMLYNSMSQQLIVRVENIDNTDCYATATIDLEVLEVPIVVPELDLIQCDDDMDGLTIFNLTQANELISVNYINEAFTYHLSESDAQSGINPIGNPTTYQNIDPSAAPDTLYVRIETTNGCYGISKVNLLVSTTDIPSTFQLNYDVCDDDLIDGDNTNGIASFDFSTAEALIIAQFPPGQVLSVTYYESVQDALAETNTILNVSDYRNEISPFAQTLIVRVDSAINNACLGLGAHITLTVNSLPEKNNVNDIEFCSDTADVVTIDLTQFDAEVIGSQNLADFNITYHELPEQADLGTDALVSPYTNSNNPQNIYARLENKATGCFVSSTNFQITVNTNPIINIPDPLELCDINNPGDQLEAFTLEDASTDILGGLTGVTLTFHEFLSDAESGSNVISSPFTNTVNNQVIYARVENDVTSCYSITTLKLLVNSLPATQTNPNNLILCDTAGTPQMFDLTENEDFIINGEIGVTATYHESLTDAQNNIGIIATPTMYNITSSLETIFVRVENNVTGCFVIVDFDIEINPIPNMSPIGDLIECEDNTDGFFNFNLETKTIEVLNGQDSNIFTVTYHTSQFDADGSINALASPFTNATNPQEIFVNITNTSSGCYIATESFFVEVQENSNANPNVANYILCDNIGDNDGFGQFDLNSKIPEILNGQDTNNYGVTFYSNFSDADLFINPIPNIYENVSNYQVIYARVDNNNTPSDLCYAITEFTLQVDLLPIFDLGDQYTLCINANGTQAVDPPLLDTELSEADYEFQWFLDGSVLTGITTSSYLALQGGNYEVLVINSVSGCQFLETANVIESGPPSITAEIITEAFTNNNIIEATVSGNGVYEFSLDNGPWQESGIFENVSGGEHTVNARDLGGCGIGIIKVLVLDYPNYFTPNDDGYNDTWNISGVGSQSNSKIYIFDRYGKLLKQLSPNGDGWDGTFNGILLPTSDYWFTIEYDEPISGKRKLFSSNFTLKR